MANIMLGKTNVPPNRPRDGRHCDLCGCSQPAVRCDKCGCQIFCLSCDDMYHRHPKRRFHLRKAVDPTPPTPQARPVLPMKIANLPTSPGDPSKMPLPPPRKKKPGKSFFDTFRRRSPSSEQNSPPLPKKEYSWTDRLGNIKKFMSNRPLPPLPDTNGHDNSDMQQSLQPGNHNLSFIHRRVEERPPELPQRSMKPNEFSRDKENFPERPPGSHAANMRNGTLDASLMNRNRGLSDDENNWDNRLSGNPQLNTLNRQNPPGFFPQGGPGFPGNLTNNMHQSSSATDLQNLEGYPGQGMPHPQYPHYPMNPHMPHFPYPMYHPQYPNYPQYFGASFANLASQPTTTDGDFSDQSEASARHHSSKKYPFRKRAKRSQSVMVDRMAYPGQYPFGPFGPFPPGYGPGPWGAAPFPTEAPPSPASSIRSLNRIGRTRRRKKMTSDDDEEFSVSSSPLSRPKSSSSERNTSAQKKAPLATQTTSDEESEEEREQNKSRNAKTSRRNSDPPKQPIQRTLPDPKRMPSPVPKSPQFHHKKASKQKQREAIRHSDSEELPSSPTKTDRRPPSRDSNADQPDQDRPTTIFVPNTQWQCNHCTFINSPGNRICQVCCKTAATETVTLMTSRPTSAGPSDSRKQSLSSEQSCSSPEKKMEEDGGINKKRDTRDMEVLNSALDEAEEEINRGLQELMKLKEDFLTSNSPPDSQVKQAESPAKTEETASKSKPVYKSSGKMRTSILDKLNLQPTKQPTKSTASTSTETQTGPSKMDRIIEARRPSTSSTYSDAYNSPTAQSPQLERTVSASGGAKNKSTSKTESSCQTQTDDLMGYLERKKVEEDAYFGRLNNGQGFQYGDRMDNITSPVPSMYDRGFGGGYGMMHRSHSRASLFTGRMNDLGPMDYGLGPTPMYRSVSRSSLTGDYTENRFSEFNNLRKPDYYLSMEELVERRRQESIRAQGLELVRMIREAEQQGFTADDIQVAMTNCGNQNPMEWLQENWRNMVENVISLSTSYANDKKENDIGTLSESEAREALRMHKGNVWAAVTECVESRQRKFLELKARGKFSSKDITDALTASQGDVEAAYAKLTKSTSKPFLMRIWGAGEGVANQDGAMPIGSETFRPQTDRYAKDNTDADDVMSDEVWDEDYEEDVDWEEDSEDPDEEEQGDLEDLRTCHDDLCISDEVKTPESDSEYADAFGSNTLERNMSPPSSDTFFVIPEIKQEKKGIGLLSKLAALRKEDRGSKLSLSKFYDSEVDLSALEAQKESKNDTSHDSSSVSDQSKASGPLSVIKNTISAIRDSVSVLKSEKKLPCATPERRTIIVKGQIAHESLSDDSSKGNVTLISSKPLEDTNSSVDEINDNQIAAVSKQSTAIEERKSVSKESGSPIPKQITSDSDKDLNSVGSGSKTNVLKNSDALISENKQINESSKGLQPPNSQTVVPSFQKQNTSISPNTLSTSDKAGNSIQSKSEVFNTQPSSSKTKDEVLTHSFEGKDNLSLKTGNKENSPKPSNALENTEKSEASQNKSQQNSSATSKNQSSTLQAGIVDINSKEVNRMENETGKTPTLQTDKKRSEDPQKVKFEFSSESADTAKFTDKSQPNQTSKTDRTINTSSSVSSSQSASQSTNKINLPANNDLKNITPDSTAAKEIVSDAVIQSNKSSNSSKEVPKTGSKSPVHEQTIPETKADGKINKESSNLPVSFVNISNENIEKPNTGSLNTAVDAFITNKDENSQESAQTSSQTPQDRKASESPQQGGKMDTTKAKDKTENFSTPNATEIQESCKSNIVGKNSTPNVVLPSVEVLDSGFTECPPVKSAIKDVDSRLPLKSSLSSSSITSLQNETIEMIDSGNTNDISSTEKKTSEIDGSSSSETKVESNLSPSEQLTKTKLENIPPVSPEGITNSETELKPMAVSSLEGDSNLTKGNSSSVTLNSADTSMVTEVKIKPETSSNNSEVSEISNSKDIEPTSEKLDAQSSQGNSESITESASVTSEKATEPKRNAKGKTKLKLVKLNKKDSESNVNKTTNSVEPSTSKIKDSSRSDPDGESNLKDKQIASDKSSEEVSPKAPVASEIYPPSLIEVIKQIPIASSQSTEQSSSPSAKPVLEGQDIAGVKSSEKEHAVSSVSSEKSQLSSEPNSNDHTDSTNSASGSPLENEKSSKAPDSDTLVPSPPPQNLQPPVENIPESIEKLATEQNSNLTPVTPTTSESTGTPTESSTKSTSSDSTSDSVPVSNLSSTSTASQEPSSATTSNESNQHSKENADPESRNVHDSISDSADSPVTPESHESIYLPSEKTDIADDKTSEPEEDEESSDDNRGVTPPNPFDAIRHRFEGLINEDSSSIGPVRPQSPYRRMSFRSRKAAIALERTRDTSVEKPWFLPKPPPEVKKTVPKRTLKQQMEIERRVRKMVSDRKCRTFRKAEIVVQLIDMNFEEDEAIQAANDCSTLEQAISYLQQECLLCTGSFPVSHIISMVHCPHKACRECLRAYFTVQIRDRNIMELLCPFCNEPDIFDEDIAQDYFNHLDIMLKKLVDDEIHELFQRKLRDRVLMRDPNFKWCSQCSSGFIAMPNLKRLVCPDCNAVTCASCRRPWEREHQGISCEAFAAWKDAADPEAQTVSLAKLLTEDGIDCPRCHFRYALAKGGCMHFRCTQCQHDFCSGCSKPFKMGQKCGVSEFCAKLGLHAHHPRNCLFYLRDKEPEDLQRLLDLSEVKYDRDPPDKLDSKNTCQVMEQKETADGMLDDYCGKDVEEGFAGLCRLHYVEYLGQLVNKHRVDPIQIFENDDLELVLRRANIRLPPKRYRETDDQYREKLVKLIQEELPLDRVEGS